MASRPAWIALSLVVALTLWLFPATAHAYVGPGAGIAFATTALALLVTTVLVIVGLLSWPLRLVYRLATRKTPPRPPKIRRAVVIGLDGLDPKLVRRWMGEGKLPNLQRIADKGTLTDLQTTYPAMSPVAWSSFATGVNPAKHGIFDFLTRDRRTYMAELSSADVGPPSRHLNIGKLQIPIGRPRLRLLRKSRPFWDILGRYRIPCCILRVPITFPPDKFHGTMLSAMCVPDLQGTQGSFTYFSSASAHTNDDDDHDDDQDQEDDSVGGQRITVAVTDRRIETELAGPPNPLRRDGARTRVPLVIKLDEDSNGATLTLRGSEIRLVRGEYTEWTEVAFPLAMGMKLRGMCRFRLLEGAPRFRLYVSPINIDPSQPVMPISHPRIFAPFLSKLIGRYGTLGLAEDTWALNEGVLDEDAFLEQAWDNHRERESMFFHMLRRTKRGLITCVFDGTDRIQHMFMRYLDTDHPARRPNDGDEKYRSVIEDTYTRMDEMVGRVLDEVDLDDPHTLVTVLSDHGFETFRRGININSWLREHGYLVLEEGRDEAGEWFEGVDWSRTQAFALGLGGIFLNIAGRESQGIVEPGAPARALADEIATKLTGLVDPACGNVAVHEAYASHHLFKGPYTEDAPDLVVGYAAGWRASWDGVRGFVNGTVFDDNEKAWSGDHCIDPSLVPGILIANRALAGAERDPAIMDMAPTFLDLFGIPTPPHMDGKSLVPS